MKQLLTSISLLAALAGAASAAPYVLPSPQPGALTPYDWQPAFGIEGLYSFADDGDMPDTYGVRGSFNLYDSGESTFRHQLDVNIAATWGSEDIRYPGGFEEDMDVFLMPVTAGYNLNIALTDDVLLYLGAKAGYAWSKVEYSSAFGSDSENGGGFTYSVGGGLKFQCSDSVYAHIGYEFGRSYLDFDVEGGDVIYGAHTISVGFSARF